MSLRFNQTGRRNRKLVRDVERLQTKLHRLGSYNKPYSALVADVRKRHYKEKFFEHLLRSAEQKTKTRSVFRRNVGLGLTILSLAVLGIAAYYFITEPSITGAVVESVVKVDNNKQATPILGWLVLLIIFSSVLGFVYNKTVAVKQK